MEHKIYFVLRGAHFTPNVESGFAAQALAGKGENMLLIIMHKKLDFLESLLSIMKKKNITDATIVEKKGIGTALFGDRDSPIMQLSQAAGGNRIYSYRDYLGIIFSQPCESKHSQGP
ncbi:MAG: hypothetical protein ACMUJM_12970 [bacterium]